MTKGSDEIPLAIWLDDDNEFSRMLASFFEDYRSEHSPEFEVAVVQYTDAAVDLVLKNARRVFMVLEDSYRFGGSGRIISTWKQLRARASRQVGHRGICGDLATYLIDAYVPEATHVLAGSWYSDVECEIIRDWTALDERVVHIGKPIEWDDLVPFPGPLPPQSPQYPRADEPLFTKQLRLWRDMKRRRFISPEHKILGPLAEEMAYACTVQPDYLYQLSPRQFEELIAALFKNHGFQVELTAQTRDGGYDIVAVSSTKLPTETILVEVKHFAPSRPVGVGIVRALYGVKALRGAEKVILVTSSYVSPDAKREFARVIPWELELKEGTDVIRWCRKYIASLRVDGHDLDA